jgi:uncharacterized protein YecE (DUF72 family)
MKGRRSYQIWKRFKESLSPLERKTDFWLFQMPPDYKYNEENLDTIGNFLDRTSLGNKAVVEFRNASWWREINEIEGIGLDFLFS